MGVVLIIILTAYLVLNGDMTIGAIGFIFIAQQCNFSDQAIAQDL